MDVICYGELLIDMIAEGAGNLSELTTFHRHAGGAAANVAAQIKCLGGDSAFVGKLGDDDFGRYLINYLEQYGIETGGVIRDPERRTTVAFVSLNRDRIPSYLFYREGGASSSIKPSDFDAEHMENGKILYTSSLMLTAPSVRETTRWVMERAHLNGQCVAFDMNLRISAWPAAEMARSVILDTIGSVDVLKINDEETVFLLNRADNDMEKLGGEMMRRYKNLNILIITCGREGSYLFSSNGASYHIPTHDIKRVDTTGAGDSYMGAFLLGLIRKDFAQDALESIGSWANAAAEITIQAPGAIDAMPDQIALNEFCQKFGIESI